MGFTRLISVLALASFLFIDVGRPSNTKRKQQNEVTLIVELSKLNAKSESAPMWLVIHMSAHNLCMCR